MEEEPRTTFVSPDLVNADAGSYNIMLDKIANSSAHFKHQQRGDPDLTVSEKREIAENLLVQNPSQFLRRFGHIVSADDLKYFDNMMNNDQISYQIDEVKRYQNRHLHQVMVKNRRYEALKKLLSEGQYFSEESMKIRDPFLYEKMVGKYLTDDQIRQRADVACSSLSGIFLSHVQAVQNNELYDRLKAIDVSYLFVVLTILNHHHCAAFYCTLKQNKLSNNIYKNFIILCRLQKEVKVVMMILIT